LELKSESLEKDKRIQELMDKTLDPKPVSRKAREDRSYATVAKKSHPKGKETMVGKKAKTGESRRRCQVTLLYAGSVLNTEKEIKTDVIKALASVDKNYEAKSRSIPSRSLWHGLRNVPRVPSIRHLTERFHHCSYISFFGWWQ
jgi:hypothetical protein